MRSAVALYGLLASLIVAAPATAAECPGNPGALGTSRTIVVDPSEHNLLGGFQYRESLPLNNKEKLFLGVGLLLKILSLQKLLLLLVWISVDLLLLLLRQSQNQL